MVRSAPGTLLMIFKALTLCFPEVVLLGAPQIVPNQLPL